MADSGSTEILSDADGPVADVHHPAGSAPICLICEHASAEIPASLGDLGLAPEDRYSHAVWDIGAGELARALSARLDAPLVLARFSRLVHDCNRPPGREDCMPARTERIEIPGNRGLGAAARAARTREVYDAFHARVDAVLDGFARPPLLMTVHSFTPVWFGTPRRTEIGLLHDADPTLARTMLEAAGPHVRTELNVPYSAADGVTHMLARHGTARGLASVMIEVRSDLLAGPAEVARIADALVAMLPAARSPEVGAA